MAAQAALLYQEAPVGVFLPNSAEKPKAMPNSTSANRAAITSLIDVFYSGPRRLTAAMLGGRASSQWRRGRRTHWLLFLFRRSDLIRLLKLPRVSKCFLVPLLESHHASSAAVPAPHHAAWAHTHTLIKYGG